MPAMHRNLPNIITMARLVMAGGFFLVLNSYRYPAGPQWVLLLAIVIFILAAATDWLDGYLARKWQVESTFGRIMDPFCDKVLVLGAFIYLSGTRFIDPVAVKQNEYMTMTTGIYAWMVVLMLARELLVTGIRGELESQGVKFGANFWGKLKMILQSVAIPVILLIVWYDPRRFEEETLIYWLPDIIAYTVVFVTIMSGLPYVIDAVKSLSKK
jgi:CDP-diacylglycerol--glycerol-3-phosphate 3-phosphatidyltransferase